MATYPRITANNREVYMTTFLEYLLTGFCQKQLNKFMFLSVLDHASTSNSTTRVTSDEERTAERKDFDREKHQTREKTSNRYHELALMIAETIPWFRSLRNAGQFVRSTRKPPKSATPNSRSPINGFSATLTFQINYVYRHIHCDCHPVQEWPA